MLDQFMKMAGGATPPLVVDFVAPSGAAVVLFKQTLPSDPPQWGGYPVGNDGSACPFGLALDGEGTAVGGGALNFLALGRWERGGRKPSWQEREAVKNGLLRKYVTLALGERHTTEEVATALEEQVGFPVKTGKTTKKDRARCAVLGVRPAHLTAAEALGLRIDVGGTSFEAAMTAFVGGGFCKAVPGAWDSVSQELAITSGLRADVVDLLKVEGLALQRIAKK